jgi:ABC-2 type transport system ATP-binding protein
MNPHKQREEFVRTIGVVFGQRSQLWWDIAVQESFRLLKKVYRVSDEDYNNHMGHVIETLEIGPLLDKPVRKLSLGQRMRCELAAALVHNPPLLFLDEPTIGLDVLVKLKIRKFLQEINEQYKTTILLTTHDLTDIEALCERVVLLDEGKIIYDGKLNQLQAHAVEGKQIEFEFLSEVPRSSLPRVENIQWEQKNATTWLGFINGDEQMISQLISDVVQRNPIKNVRINEVSTEEIVRKIYEEGMALT